MTQRRRSDAFLRSLCWIHMQQLSDKQTISWKLILTRIFEQNSTNTLNQEIQDFRRGCSSTLHLKDRLWFVENTEVLNLMEVAGQIVFDELTRQFLIFVLRTHSHRFFYLLILEKYYWLLLFGCCYFVENTPREFFDTKAYCETCVMERNKVLVSERTNLLKKKKKKHPVWSDTLQNT